MWYTIIKQTQGDYSMPKRKTHNQFIIEVKEKFKDEYTVLGKYEKASAKILIKHNKCNKEYYVRASAFLSGARCTHCFKPIKKTTEEFKKEVNELVGNEYMVIGEYNGNKNKVKMIHNICGNEYEVSPGHFLYSGRRCPYCQGGSPQTKDSFPKKFNKVSQGDFILKSEYKTNRDYILVKHLICGLEYSVRAGNFLSGKGCPSCKQSSGERRISNILKENNISFISQKRFEDCRNIKPLPFDFAILNKGKYYLIEYNGKQHYQSIDFFGGEDGFQKRIKNDKIKHDYCVDNNIELFYISFEDNLEEKMKEIIYKIC